MPRKTTRKKGPKEVETLRHTEAKRRNIPSAEHQSVLAEAEKAPVEVRYARGGQGLDEEKAQRNRDLDPQLVWRGKDEQDQSDLVVNAQPLYIQERIHPKVLIDDLMRRSVASGQGPVASEENQGDFADLFSDFNGLPEEARSAEFYQHDANWSNRMILGDSLQVMASLAEREGLRGKVQCIYIDPPYGIKFNSNFQWSTTSRDVKDGNAGHITREPEQVKAFRDTWRDGIHSYLTYLRDRLTVARDLLHDSGSIFVQIGDENVHRVRAVMDEVFGQDNFVNLVFFEKTSSSSTQGLAAIGDFVLWFAKVRPELKFRTPYREKLLGEEGTTQYVWLDEGCGFDRRLSRDELSGDAALIERDRVFACDNLTSQRPAQGADVREFVHQGKAFKPGKGTFKTDLHGLMQLAKAGRLRPIGKSLMYKRKLGDFYVIPLANYWNDVKMTGFSEDKTYIVQTSQKVVQRCLLMATDPGDLVLDPTCGSGTTAYVAEQWGRRWITIDTSRVSLALARARIMGARYPFYLLADSPEGQQKEAEISGQWPVASGQKFEPTRSTHGNIRHGFVYERVPHITLKSIANNAEIDVIWESYEQKLEPLRGQLSKLLTDHKSLATGHCLEEWEVPRERPDDWPPATEPLLTEYWTLRVQRQKEIDASIAAKADSEYLYDKPYTDNKKVRVAGPFTVESLSPHRVLGVDEDDELIDSDQWAVAGEDGGGYGKPKDFASVMLETLKIAGVQQAHKEDKITFTSITPWPGRLVCAEGRFAASDQWPVASGQEPAAGDQQALATDHRPLTTDLRAAVFIGPEFGTVSRPDLVEAAREAGDAGFDVLIACAFNYEARASEFNKLGSVPILKARMNADLHMANDLKNTGKGNLFVIFGEPDISVVSGQWLVASDGRLVADYETCKELSGLGSLEEINRAGRAGLSAVGKPSARGKIRGDQPASAGGGVGGGEHRGGSGAGRDKGVSAVPRDSERVAGGDRDVSDSGGAAGAAERGPGAAGGGAGAGGGSDAQRAQTLAALKDLKDADFPLTLTTDHWTQITVNGVDVFKPQTGEVESSGPEGIACWFVDTDYNEESFFVRHAYFLGQSDPYKALKTTLKAEINEEAWETLHSATSRPFPKPENGRIAVKVINHLGDEVMKVFRVGQ